MLPQNLSQITRHSSSSSSSLSSLKLRYYAHRFPVIAQISALNTLRTMMSTPSPPQSIDDIPKSWNFTSKLPPDPKYPTPYSSYNTPRHHIIPRILQKALFTYVSPAPSCNIPSLLSVSKAALKTLNIDPATTSSPSFLATVSGNKIHGWDPENPDGSPGYSWAQCYGGFQFGQWAGQLGDGRAISLFETTNPEGTRYEVQLKGAGITPYSRFADGRAVVRSSIREYVVSEYLNAIGIKTTRALALTLLPGVDAARETLEPCAIVTRFAETWVRLGTLDLPRIRQDFETLRVIVEYVAMDVFGGWDKLPGRLEEAEAPSADPLEEPRMGIPMDAIEGPEGKEENRFARLYRAIVRRNSEAVASWQAYGFLNGVLNTDNTSIIGLSMDYGPFAFMDVFDPMYTPNHDDFTGRYAYCRQPTIIWWNLVRCGEALAHLMGAASRVDDDNMKTRDDFVAAEDQIIPRAEALIGQAGEEYKAVFTATYRRLLLARLGLKTPAEDDVTEFLPQILDCLKECKMDFHRFFRLLSSVKLSEVGKDMTAEALCDIFDVPAQAPGTSVDKLVKWLGTWRERAAADWPGETGDIEREVAMKKVNPHFVPRSWVLNEVIDMVQKEQENDVLRRVMHMALNPFDDDWTGKEFNGEVYQGNKDEEQRWCGRVPVQDIGIQCSCSS